MRSLSAIAVILCCAASFASAQQHVPLAPTAAELAPPPAGPAPAPGLVVPTAQPEVQIPLMTIDQDAVFLRSAWGQRAQSELEQRGAALASENERLAQALSREEEELTELRKTLPADEFRARAEEFDKRVVEVRRERAIKVTELQQYADGERDAFQQVVRPILARMMQERGAVAVLDLRVLFVSAEAIDVTDELIEEVDAVAGAGPATVPETGPAGDAPQNGAGAGGQGAVSPPAPENGADADPLLPDVPAQAPDQSAGSGDSAE